MFALNHKGRLVYVGGQEESINGNIERFLVSVNRLSLGKQDEHQFIRVHSADAWVIVRTGIVNMKDHKDAKKLFLQEIEDSLSYGKSLKMDIDDPSNIDAVETLLLTDNDFPAGVYSKIEVIQFPLDGTKMNESLGPVYEHFCDLLELDSALVAKALEPLLSGGNQYMNKF